MVSVRQEIYYRHEKMLRGISEDRKERLLTAAGRIRDVESLRLFYVLTNLMCRQAGSDRPPESVRLVRRAIREAGMFLVGKPCSEGWDIGAYRGLRGGRLMATGELDIELCQVKNMTLAAGAAIVEAGEPVFEWMMEEIELGVSQLMAFCYWDTGKKDIMRWMESEELWRRDYVNSSSPEFNALCIAVERVRKMSGNGRVIGADETPVRGESFSEWVVRQERSIVWMAERCREILEGITDEGLRAFCSQWNDGGVIVMMGFVELFLDLGGHAGSGLYLELYYELWRRIVLGRLFTTHIRTEEDWRHGLELCRMGRDFASDFRKAGRQGRKGPGTRLLDKIRKLIRQ